MERRFYKEPILNSPYEYPAQHWELDEQGQPTHQIINSRRKAEYVTPIPTPRKQKKAPKQADLDFEEQDKQYDPTPVINDLRQQVDLWRSLPNPRDWNVTPMTVRLLEHWRRHQFSHIRPFFCQIEAVETLIWLTEVAPAIGRHGKRFLEHLANANNEANPGLMRLALKLATGAGKTTVMAMIIAWQTLNAVRHPDSKKFTRGFLVVTPGLTIRDRLRVLQPNDPDSYYASRELVPGDLLQELGKAKIVITNYHAFKRRDTLDISSGGRALLQGRRGKPLDTLQTEGQMLQAAIGDLMGMKNILAINDEAHHCYRERPNSGEEEALKGDDLDEAKRNNEAARLWISGLEAVQRTLGLLRVVDLSATPFFLKGSGYDEGTLFHWTMSDFSLMDAIECGIVKLPRVPVADNVPGGDMPKFRNLWDNIRPNMPKMGRGKAKSLDKRLDPLSLPTMLKTALEALYGHYAKTFDLWLQADIVAPPCFIVVCNNTSTSKLVYDYISGFHYTNDDGSVGFMNGALELFRNFDEYGNAFPRPRTLLIDSEQLESGEGLDANFRAAAAEEIEQFRNEMRQRGDHADAEKITDQHLLREVMNTVGKPGRLGESIRCVVSVSMLTEGWDANNVTHILGVRAFGTQLLCEQVIGRALRRQSYDLNDKNLLNVEYADVLGVPFDFTSNSEGGQPEKPRPTYQVFAVSPERDACEIVFPRVASYRVELPEERIAATFTDDSILELTPDLVGPSSTTTAGIIGEEADLSLKHTEEMRRSSLSMNLTKRLIYTKWRKPGEEPKIHLFGQFNRIVRQWLDHYLVCKGGTTPAQLMYQELADMACNRIMAAMLPLSAGQSAITVMLDPYNPIGSTAHVRFITSKMSRWQTNPRKCHVNWVVLDSDWEAEFCRVAEAHPAVIAYVKNQGLNFDVPYHYGSIMRIYRPDFIVKINDGRPDPLHLIVEIKGFRREDAKEKKTTMETYWIPGVNNARQFGRWAFVEFTDVYDIESGFAKMIESMSNYKDCT